MLYRPLYRRPPLHHTPRAPHTGTRSPEGAAPLAAADADADASVDASADVEGYHDVGDVGGLLVVPSSLARPPELRRFTKRVANGEYTPADVRAAAKSAVDVCRPQLEEIVQHVSKFLTECAENGWHGQMPVLCDMWGERRGYGSSEHEGPLVARVAWKQLVPRDRQRAPRGLRPVPILLSPVVPRRPSRRRAAPASMGSATHLAVWFVRRADEELA